MLKWIKKSQRGGWRTDLAGKDPGSTGPVSMLLAGRCYKNWDIARNMSLTKPDGVLAAGVRLGCGIVGEK